MIELYIGIGFAFVIGAIIIGTIMGFTLKREKHIDLVLGKLQNSDSSIANAVSFLKLTNEWSAKDGIKQ